MQTLYGVKISDRVTVRESKGLNATIRYEAYFDGEHVGRFTSGVAAVKGTIDWLRQRSEDQAKKVKDDARSQERQQERDDEAFLRALEVRLGLDTDDLDRLIEIISRRRD